MEVVTVKISTFQVSQDMGIETPIPISVRLRDLNNVFCKIVHAAQQPHLSIPETEAGKTRRQYRQLLNRSLMVVSGEQHSYLIYN
jgi:Ras family protein T1